MSKTQRNLQSRERSISSISQHYQQHKDFNSLQELVSHLRIGMKISEFEEFLGQPDKIEDVPHNIPPGEPIPPPMTNPLIITYTARSRHVYEYGDNKKYEYDNAYELQIKLLDKMSGLYAFYFAQVWPA